MELAKESLGKVAITIDKCDWDIDCSYPALHVVWVAGAHKSYISRKPVPAGVLITDSDYWRPFSALDEQIVLQFNQFKRQFRGLLIDYADCIDGLQKQVNRISTMLDTGIKFSGNKTGVSLAEGETTTVTLYFNTNTQETATTVNLYKDAVLYQTYTDVTNLSIEVPISDTTSFVVKAEVNGVLYTGGWIVQNTIVPN